MIARQIPDDPHGAEMVLAAKMEHLLFDLDRRLIGVPLRDRGAVHQAGLSVLPISCTPPVETAATHPKIPASFGHLPGRLSMLRNTKLPYDIALVLAHEHLLHSRTGSLSEMSREHRHSCKGRQRKRRNRLASQFRLDELKCDLVVEFRRSLGQNRHLFRPGITQRKSSFSSTLRLGALAAVET